MKISVGSAPSHWGRNKLGNFYCELAQSPVDYVYLGETACPYRSCFSPDFLDKVCNELTRAGKTVYASSLVLITDEKQYRAFGELAQRLQRVEINSPAFLGYARRYAAVAGMFLNIYNSAAADILAKYMIKRTVLPCELSFQSIACIAKKHTVPTEVVVYGHIPVAVSGTCHTARSFGRKDNACKQLCREYPEGMVLEAGNQPLFRIDGPQTLSAATYCLLEYLPQLEKAGVDTVRILPQYLYTDRIVHIYKDVLMHRRHWQDALGEIKALSPMGLCNGWFLGKAGWIYESQTCPERSRRIANRKWLIANGDTPPGTSEVRSQKPEVRETIARPGVRHNRKSPSDYAALEGCCSAWQSFDVIGELNLLVEMMNRDAQFVKQVAKFKGTAVLLSATDTGREFIIEFDEQCVRVRPYAGETFDVKISAAEQVHWAVLSGQMDADAAFFSGKVRIWGSVATAFRVKNRFLSLLQSHLGNQGSEFGDQTSDP